jgi:hypothetical protein
MSKGYSVISARCHFGYIQTVENKFYTRGA